MLLKWAASQCFPRCKGGRQELEAQANSSSVLAEWEKLIAPHRQVIYMVTELTLADEKEISQLNSMLRDETTGKDSSEGKGEGKEKK